MSGTYWEVCAAVERKTTDGYTSVVELPTFYLNSNVQGILDINGASRVARNLLETTAGEGASILLFSVVPLY